MVLVTLREAAEKLPELFASALNGETVVIVGDDQARVTLLAESPIIRPQFGSGRDGIAFMREDFYDALDEDFAEYME